MENLIFSLNATVPVFLIMVLGAFFYKVGWIDDVFASKMNKFVFTVPLPVLLFGDLAAVDFEQVWNLKFVVFCFAVTVVSIMISAGVSCLWKDRSVRGEFIQSSYRSSAAILGIAFIQNIYGTAGMAPLMIIGSVPLYNIMAVLVLSVFKPGQPWINRSLIRQTFKGILTNPIILGIAAGLIWSLLRLPMPQILAKTVSSVGGIATPLGLPAAVRIGFRNEELVAILVMLGSATTVTCFVMAKNMGHEGVLSSGVVMLTTLFSAFTLTGWLYLLRSLGLI